MGDCLEKRASKIHGFGIFAKVRITKGKAFYKIPLDAVYGKPKKRCARIGDGRYVSDAKVLNWVNHSCKPNAKLDINRKNPILVALRDIKPNEEITVDYNQTEIKNVGIECTCGTRKCRGYFNVL
jgi:SET domain-containing protein